MSPLFVSAVVLIASMIAGVLEWIVLAMQVLYG